MPLPPALPAAIVAYMLASEGIKLFESGQQRGLAREELALQAETAKAGQKARARAAKETQAMTDKMIKMLMKERKEGRAAGRESQALGFLLGLGQQGMSETQNLAQIFSGMADRSIGGPTPRPNSMASLLR